MSDQMKELERLWKEMMAARVDAYDIQSQIVNAEAEAVEAFNQEYRALSPSFSGIDELDVEVDLAYVGDDGYKTLADLIVDYPLDAEA